MTVIVVSAIVSLVLLFGFMLVLGLLVAYPWLLLVPLVVLVFYVSFDIGREFARTFARIAHDHGCKERR